MMVTNFVNSKVVLRLVAFRLEHKWIAGLLQSSELLSLGYLL